MAANTPIMITQKLPPFEIGQYKQIQDNESSSSSDESNYEDDDNEDYFMMEEDINHQNQQGQNRDNSVKRSHETSSDNKDDQNKDPTKILSSTLISRPSTHNRSAKKQR